MRERQDQVAQVDWDKFQLEVHEPRTWLQLISQFRGLELAIVAVAVIAVSFVMTPHLEAFWVAIAGIGAVSVLGLATRWRKSDGSSNAQPTKNTAEPGYAGGNEATA